MAISRDSDSDDMSIKNLSEGILICEWAILDSMGNVKSDFEKIGSVTNCMGISE